MGNLDDVVIISEYLNVVMSSHYKKVIAVLHLKQPHYTLYQFSTLDTVWPWSEFN